MGNGCGVQNDAAQSAADDDYDVDVDLSEDRTLDTVAHSSIHHHSYFCCDDRSQNTF